MRTCATWGEPLFGNPWTVALLQKAVDNFTVKYGMSVKEGLTYDEAATEFGACVMHFAACDGKLDNREKRR